MTFTRWDSETNEIVECGSRIVKCGDSDCGNSGIEIEVPDDPEATVICGGEMLSRPGQCGALLD